jgi:hypothetical protein
MRTISHNVVFGKVDPASSETAPYTLSGDKPPKGWSVKKWERGAAARKAAALAKAARSKLRHDRLSTPITPGRIARFCKHLMAVPFGMGEECWFYVGCGKSTTLGRDISVSTRNYPQVTFNKEQVGAHQFALAVSEKLLLSDLKGFDVHHGADLGQCFGYACCNPDHLAKREHVEHAGNQGRPNTANPRHVKMVEEVLNLPVQQVPITPAGAGRRRFLGGVPFLIHFGVLKGMVLEAQ